MAQTPEAKVKDEIRKYLTSLGVWFAGKPQPANVTGWCYMPVQMGMGVGGIPDFVGVFMGKPLFIEAKAAKGSTSAIQDKRIEELAAAGVAVIIARSAEDVRQGLMKAGFDVC